METDFHKFFGPDYVPVVNIDLLQNVLIHIETYPEFWYQSAWRINGDAVNRNCNTAFCFAGWAAQFTNVDWYSSSTDISSVRVFTPPSYNLNLPFDEQMINKFEESAAVIKINDELVAVEDYAQMILGLTDKQARKLFAGDNSISKIRETIAHIFMDSHATSVFDDDDEIYIDPND